MNEDTGIAAMGPIELEQYDIPDTSTSDVFPFY